MIVSAMILFMKAHEQLLDNFDEEDVNEKRSRRKVPRVMDYCEII